METKDIIYVNFHSLTDVAKKSLSRLFFDMPNSALSSPFRKKGQIFVP